MRNSQRIAIIGEGPAALSAAENLLRAGMCVDLISARTAPFGLLRRFAGLSGVLAEAVAGAADGPAHCAAGMVPRLRLIGNVRVGSGPDADITHRELHQLASRGDRELIILELKARGVAVTTWEGLCAPAQLADAPEDWATVISRAQLAPVCF
ncbi:methylenetetrahydrofolate--tRNA-(uracil-5-)-methyltransferase [Corynebacterium lizhenjunii]|uniref:methylenetetrahydrofolate--tRNA-(uracil-5-)- methyltransferase n=1 Tax=Corynebacterium lizhenjunii TaxID=2709394 RepID=UPI0013EE1FCA|nr:methylenetetrahydrofolate--tRNA-(uracil-5-)-methyltransferase [Corynebacterium lizhenjunii]